MSHINRTKISDSTAPRSATEGSVAGAALARSHGGLRDAWGLRDGFLDCLRDGFLDYCV
jgi:hypothetical protein